MVIFSNPPLLQTISNPARHVPVTACLSSLYSVIITPLSMVLVTRTLQHPHPVPMMVCQRKLISTWIRTPPSLISPTR